MKLNPQDVYVFYAQRSAIGKLAGALKFLRPDDLLSQLLNHFKQQDLFPIEKIDDVIVGCSNQAGEDNRNIARMSLVLSGLPFSIPGATLNRLCASSLDALIDAYARIKSGLNHCLLVGGVESMTRAPYVLGKSSEAFARNQKFYDTSLGWRFENPQMQKRIPLLSMGQTAERVAQKFSISRSAQDNWALRSHQLANLAQSKGYFDQEIVALQAPDSESSKRKYLPFTKDEGPRSNTSLEQLSLLAPVFSDDIETGSVTAGNSSSLNDGGALLALASGQFILENNLKPIARVIGGQTAGVDPSIMGIGPVASTQKLLNKFNLKISDFDLFELNEAFASQVLACIQELKINPEKVNIAGGSLALGHPLGCSGARITTTLIHNMQRSGAKLGLASMCVGVGQGVSLAVESLR